MATSHAAVLCLFLWELGCIPAFRHPQDRSPLKTVTETLDSTIMRISRAVILVAAIALPPSSAQYNNTVEVEFEYQLEVQDTTTSGTTADVLDYIDENMMGDLRGKLPGVNAEGIPRVEFVGIQSEIYSVCFTDSDECSLVRSSIKVVVQEKKSEQAAEYVTLELVQSYLDQISSSNKGLTTTYGYPSIVSSLAEFQMSYVDGRMTDREIKILEKRFMEVFGAIVLAIEGDTEIRDVKFLYQALLADSVNTPSGTSSMTADLRIAGYCRDCTSLDFQTIVVEVIEENTPAFMNKLRTDSNSTYFSGVTNITCSVPQLPDPLGPVSDASIFDKKVPVVNNKQPWFLTFGIVMAILIVCGGCYFVVQDSIAYEKDHYSTGDDSCDDDDDDAFDEEVEGVYSEEGKNYHEVTVSKKGEGGAAQKGDSSRDR
jgi:hypothetical protein